MLSDVHVHLDALNGESANELLRSGAGILAVSCDPEGYERAKRLIATSRHSKDANGNEGSSEGFLHAALGLHPWSIPAEGASPERREVFAKQLESFVSLADKERFIGEVGLDFWGECSLTHDEQLSVFKRMCTVLSARDHVLSLHTRGADRETLDCLEASDIVPGNGHVLILHGFNGSSTQMTRARKLGCLFSFGERELRTKKGREYARQLPLDCLLLETDAPCGQIIGAHDRYELSASEWQSSLSGACELLASIKGLEQKEVESALDDTFNRL